MTQNVTDSPSSVPTSQSSSSYSTLNNTTLENQVLISSSMPYNSKGQHVGNGHVEMADLNGYGEKESPHKNKSDKKERKKVGNSAETNLNDYVVLGQNQLDNGSTANSINSLNKSRENFSDDSFSDSYIPGSFDEDSHREMAIDVPDHFIGTIKTPPKYPPPLSSTNSSPRAPPSTPLKNSDLARNKAQTDNVLTTTANNMNINQQMPLNDDQMERLRKHQEDIRKRREDEDRRKKEAEFLRTSLRGSKKLQALEQIRTSPEGFINTAYMENDEEGYASGRHTGRDSYMRKNIALEDLLSSLQYIRSRLSAAEGKQEISFLMNLFNNNQFKQAVEVHNKLIDVTSRSPHAQPQCSNLENVVEETVSVLYSCQTPQAKELLDLLHEPNLKNLIFAHDKVADQALKPIPDEVPLDFHTFPVGEDSIKIVHLEKTNEPLGATVRNEGESVIIGRIVKGGIAEQSGLLHEGDEILEINRVDMKGKSIHDVSEMLANMSGTITFMIIPNNQYNSRPSTQDELTHVRALFKYDPEDDIYIPCQELGISFDKGDILHVINRDDQNWWQAYREGEEEHQSLAGLIPSKTFQEQRESMRLTLGGENKENEKSHSCACGRRAKNKKKKNAHKQQVDVSEILTYEEVAQYYPEPNRRRPVVLIGPPNVGRHELRQRLMTDFERFAAAVPHTSRPLKDSELDGKDYHFISRAEFEADIRANKFVEFGEFEKNWYGTSINAVRQVINMGKICVLNLDPEALPNLKNSDLKPYVVFVYPPNLDNLRQIHVKSGIANVSNDDLRDIIERAREMEDQYGHYFDYVLTNYDMDQAYDELLREINKIEVEPQWVPAAWLNN
ncbi:hypothetical protein ACJMK2_036842 [Sinanodonta woodiana]|uniref:Protein PALS1 n=1 Tax=Sinanodonta woodiana TaxID=1069815 RepID=A0ABD3WKK1_SINWO